MVGLRHFSTNNIKSFFIQAVDICFSYQIFESHKVHAVFETEISLISDTGVCLGCNTGVGANPARDVAPRY